MPKILMILRLLWQEPWQISWKAKTTPSGVSWSIIPKYGEQLKISRYERAKPSSKGLVKYFSSDHFKGIGLKTAQKSWTSMGTIPLTKFLEAPEN